MFVKKGAPRRNKNKQVVCSQCCHVLRSDNLKRHLRTHQTSQYDVKAKKQKKSIITREIAINDDSFEKMGDILPVETIVEQVIANSINEVVKNLENNHNFYRDIEKEVIRESEIFDKNIKLGEKISMIISSGRAKEESLSKKNKYCLEIFRKNHGLIDVASANLKPWQLKLCDFFQSPTQREILWVIGRIGNEGKTWFQSYVESRYGYERVARMDINGRSQDILHALGKRPLCSTDIFLFNIPRSEFDVDICFSVLESIKDGLGVSPKYDSKRLHFKTPNVVMVFSNGPPDVQKLSKDRWTILTIKNKGTDLELLQMKSRR